MSVNNNSGTPPPPLTAPESSSQQPVPAMTSTPHELKDQQIPVIDVDDEEDEEDEVEMDYADTRTDEDRREQFVYSMSEKDRKMLFGRELRFMMFGFGDTIDPLPESVELMDEMVQEYMSVMTRKAMKLAATRGTAAKMTVDDIRFLIRKDRKKFARVVELLRMNEELKQARSALTMDTPDV
eukprot:TRINITY_DN186_c0_g1_i2.p1 TRINITY_DN186_c0_g1~~TRINITY_DN186_c0_g1_i2.p1  ORF type:complete len:182 (+),score=69.35 TRINITY_DN186_c0_g1_i2:163-708(+)